MILYIISWAALLARVAAASNIRSDIAFNDRFDIADMVKAQNKYFDNLNMAASPKRRANMKLDARLSELYRKHYAQLGKDNLVNWYLSHMRRTDDSNKYPKIVQNDLTISNYNKNLARFLKKVRRSGDKVSIPLEEFSFHETDNVENGGHDSSYEKNLNLFRVKAGKEEYRKRLQKYVNKLHGLHQDDLEHFYNRRSNVPRPKPEDEVFLHNAFPFKLKITGYLKEPVRSEKRI